MSTLTRVARDLVARTVPADPAGVDLAAIAGRDGYLLERDGHGLAGRGIALRIALPGGLAATGAATTVNDALAAIGSADEVGAPGCGPVALGALPFDATTAASLVVPRLLAGRTADGLAWTTTITAVGERDESSAAPAAAAATPPPRIPDEFKLTPSMSHQAWCALVAQAVSDIRRGDLDKIVLARDVSVEANSPIDVPSVVARLRALYPSCLVFSIGGFVGATPELLVRRTGRRGRAHPLAGTIPRSGDPDTDAAAADAFMSSSKERAEHRFAVDDVAGVLAPLCPSFDVPDAPSVISLRNVCHLGTRLEGVLAEPAPTALELAARLHPTAAVGGAPRADALQWLKDHERLDRGPYAGPVGWVDSGGDGEWRVAIRSALVDGNRARLFAGVGVVADSEPLEELAETQLKLQALLAALVRP